MEFHCQRTTPHGGFYSKSKVTVPCSRRLVAMLQAISRHAAGDYSQAFRHEGWVNIANMSIVRSAMKKVVLGSTTFFITDPFHQCSTRIHSSITDTHHHSVVCLTTGP
jgi:hypothetical protein